jgi:Protein kinase domain
MAGCRIEERLPMGGMSVVYRAEHLHLGRKVAIKLLDARLAEDEDYRKRFLRESRLAAALYHPNIVPIYDAGEADGVPYITMHFVQGIDLAALLRAEGALPPHRAMAIVGQVAAALDVAHDRGLVHRDVKPANILIASGEGVEPEGHVYLTDFGLAKQVASGTALTRQGLFMGTLDYVAPEQIQGHEVDRRTDVYSLGCVVYECLAGKVPFARESEVAMLYAHMEEPPPVPSASRPELPSAVDAAVARAMAKQAGDRYATCRELVEDLTSALEAASLAEAERAGGVSVVDQPAPVPEETPVAPALVGVASIDYRGARFGLGRTAEGYAVWNLEAGGHPVRLFPLTDEAWGTAWATFEELEATPAEEAAPLPVAEPEPIRPAEPLLVGVVFLDYRGSRYALGRTEDAYAIWDQQAGGYPVQTFALHPQAWPEVWHRYQGLEAAETAPASAAEEAPALAGGLAPTPTDLTGAVAVDYRGAGYALGRTSGGYAIWDLAAGGNPVRVYQGSPDAWTEAWQAFQDLEARRPG